MRQWFLENYGSKRCFLYTHWHRALFFLGRYRQYRQINWQKVDRLVFVCKGNICRSAFAEIVAKPCGVDSTSCGVETRDGLPADKKAVQAAIRKGKDLNSHRTRKFTSITVSDRDLFIVMEPWHIKALEEKLGKNVRCTILGLWGKPASPYIHDPYGSMPYYFDRCFDYIEKSVSEMTNEIRKAKASKH